MSNQIKLDDQYIVATSPYREIAGNMTYVGTVIDRATNEVIWLCPQWRSKEDQAMADAIEHAEYLGTGL